MLMPNRHESSDKYRYGFQGQEKDNEIKGIGNSINYKFRMYSPKVGRFFAVDPLTAKYPWYTPYSFSGNKVIAYGELEGLEEEWKMNIYFAMKESADPKLSKVESREVYWETLHYLKGNNIISGEEILVGTGIALDLRFNKGRLTKQFATQVTVNATASWIIDGSVNFENVFKETVQSFDFADAGIDQIGDIVLDKYKIGKIKKALIKVSASAFFDLTVQDGVKVQTWKENSGEIMSNIIINSLLEYGNIKVDDLIKDVPIVKLNKNVADKVVTQFKETFSKVLDNLKVSDSTNKEPRINLENKDKIKNKYSEQMKEKRDVIPDTE